MLKHPCCNLTVARFAGMSLVFSSYTVKHYGPIATSQGTFKHFSKSDILYCRKRCTLFLLCCKTKTILAYIAYLYFWPAAPPGPTNVQVSSSSSSSEISFYYSQKKSLYREPIVPVARLKMDESKEFHDR